MQTIEFLISTTDKTDLLFLDKMFKHTDITQFKILVINQCLTIDIPSNINIKNSNIRVISVKDKGLSKSRNLAIANAIGDIIIPTDDDVIYNKYVVEIVNQTFQNLKIDIATFKISTPEGHPFKKYSIYPFFHTIRTLLKVSSIEIAIRVDSIRNTEIFYDEKFGLGSEYPSGEENIYLTDALKKGLSIQYLPETIAIHPHITSGKLLDTEMLETKGAVFCRLFGYKALLYFLPFAFKKKVIINKQNISTIKCISLLFKGFYKYRRKTS